MQASPLRPPDSSDFDLLELLGRGSYGSVFKGMARASGELFAIKVIPISEGVSPEPLRPRVCCCRRRACRRKASTRFGTRLGCCR